MWLQITVLCVAAVGAFGGGWFLYWRELAPPGKRRWQRRDGAFIVAILVVMALVAVTGEWRSWNG
jgi:hypothetical protein